MACIQDCTMAFKSSLGAMVSVLQVIVNYRSLNESHFYSFIFLKRIAEICIIKSHRIERQSRAATTV